MNAKVPGFYYESQLTKSPPPSSTEYFLIEKVLKQKKIKGENYYFVKYLYFPKAFNQWVKESNIKRGET